MSELIITIEHMRGVPGFGVRPGLCARGGRLWAERQGLDWAAFVRDGIPAEQLLATGDPFALATVEHARALEASRNGR